jgi:hypothetical protein
MAHSILIKEAREKQDTPSFLSSQQKEEQNKKSLKYVKILNFINVILHFLSCERGKSGLHSTRTKSI